jgi:calcineurin-like phosphoesterase family protein
MSKRWIYSDPHYYHANVIKYTSRPFSSVEEMNKELIKRHNLLINKQDKVFILGDFSLGNKQETADIISQLKGYLILIMGNHDKSRSRKWFLDCGFNEVIKYPIILKDSFILSHEPVYLSEDMPYVNIHGHLHGNILLDEKTYKTTLSTFNKKSVCLNRYVNVCVENSNFYPVFLNTIIDQFM